MLIQFSVKNFRSIREEQCLSFAASSDKSHRDTHCISTEHSAVPDLLRSAVIYGPNACGKSNLIFALVTMQQMVLKSTRFLEDQYSDQFTPFLLDSESRNRPTEFEIILLINGIRYQYGFAYDAERILEEWLFVYRSNKPQKWFERRYDKKKNRDTWATFSTYFKGDKEVWKRTTRKQALYLTQASQSNSEQLLQLYNWFSQELIVLPAHSTINLFPTLIKLEDPNYKKLVLQLMNAADIHINDIKVEKKKGQQFEFRFETGKPPDVRSMEKELPEIQFCHSYENGDQGWFDRKYESFGTQRLLAYSGPLLDALSNGRLLVVDEFDTSLHPLLTRYVISLVHSIDIPNKGAQLWMTTHDTTLLDPDLLRRDQVWFMEKDKNQASQLYSLTEFRPRKNEALERGYLLGRYGALPYLSEFMF